MWQHSGSTLTREEPSSPAAVTRDSHDSGSQAGQASYEATSFWGDGKGELGLVPTFMSSLAGVTASDMEEAQEPGHPWRRKGTLFVDGPLCAVWHQVTLTTTECAVVSPALPPRREGQQAEGGDTPTQLRDLPTPGSEISDEVHPLS